MDRLSIVLTLMTGAVITGVLVIAAFALGFYGWPPVLLAAVIGAVLAWPVGYIVSRRIKRNDPGFDHTRAEPEALPDPRAPEV